jgi:hypothetical protein
MHPQAPLYWMNPLFLEPFMKKLTRERVVPNHLELPSALTFSTTDFDSDCLPERAGSKKIRASRFSLECRI